MYFTDTFTVLQRSTTGVKSSLISLCITASVPDIGMPVPERGAPVPDTGNAVPERGTTVLQHSWGTGIGF